MENGLLPDVGSARFFTAPKVHRVMRVRLSPLRRMSTAPFAAFTPRLDLSFIRELRPDPQTEDFAPNQDPRDVRSGHYVRVAPTPLRAPYLIAVTEELAAQLGLTPQDCASEAFLRAFSGDPGAAPGLEARGWATPYALSIYGREQLPPGSGPQGLGYGDGRAISIAEVLLEAPAAAAPPPPPPPPPALAPRLELQLKGGGRTPFCRGADGAAVLRSSVREFLASEAMFHLGVPTTRALSLVASAADVVVRPWYTPGGRGGPGGGGDVMVGNRRAITTRAAASFLRVGQFELFGRRAARGEATGLAELALLARHALAREYPAHAVPSDAPPGALQAGVLGLLREASARLAALAAGWLRVGYVQSNFNSDNCLVGGVTMDYGPFGFLERYDPKWSMWIGGGEHFAFMNQPLAAEVNFAMLVRSLLPLLDPAGVEEARGVLRAHRGVSDAALASMWARKLGFPGGAAGEAAAAPLWAALERLMAAHGTDYTILFRQLCGAVAPGAAGDGGGGGGLAQLEPAFYAPLPPPLAAAWREWLASWRAALAAAGATEAGAAVAMRAANPKYVPREWLLVEAYEAAEAGDHAPLLALRRVLREPYAEQPEAEAKYYRRAPPGAEEKPGCGFMSCSS